MPWWPWAVGGVVAFLLLAWAVEERWGWSLTEGVGKLLAVAWMVAVFGGMVNGGLALAGLDPLGLGWTDETPQPATTFCDTHDCIPNFEAGVGSIVQCVDGMWSHSGGRPGACSGHRGESTSGVRWSGDDLRWGP